MPMASPETPPMRHSHSRRHRARPFAESSAPTWRSPAAIVHGASTEAGGQRSTCTCHSVSSNKTELEAECVVHQDRGDSTWRRHAVDDENVVHPACDAVRLPGAAVLEREAILVDPSQSGSDVRDDLLTAYHKNHVASP